jgi:arylsulfatase A-like enzyme
MPTIVSWPRKIKPGKSDALWNQLDLMASLSEVAGYTLDDGEAIDSENVLNAILGKSEKGRNTMLVEAFTFGYRKGKLKYIAPTDKDHSWIKEEKNIEGGVSERPQLYDLSIDPGEQNNIADDHPELVKQLDHELQAIKNKAIISVCP